MNRLALAGLVQAALAEDRADLDLTTLAVIPADAAGRGRIIAKQRGILAGLPVAEEVFTVLDPEMAFSPAVSDGARLEPGDTVAEIGGSLRALLTGERTALNFLQHLSGVATAVAELVAAAGNRATILDTRKTLPGLRSLEKYAVRVGGGANHRFSLADMVLIKDNHIAAAGGVAEAVRRARSFAPPYVRLEVETENEAQVREALEAGADIIMLDNMPPAEMRRMVELIGGRAKIEASGNITAATVREVAGTGVDYISAGYLTHSAPALDLSLEIESQIAG